MLDKWLRNVLDSDKEKILKYSHQEQNEFFKENLRFFNGGVKAKMGLGSSLINVYTISRLATGIASYINDKEKDATVCVCYDTHHQSKKFAKTVSSILAANNIKVFIYDEEMPTPSLSFAVRYLHSFFGLVITASYFPKEYNGLYMYNEQGEQLNDISTEEVNKYLDKVELFDFRDEDFNTLVQDKKIVIMSEEIKEAYIRSDLSFSLEKSPRNLRVCFTPLHGTAYKCISKALEIDGFRNVDIVKEQAEPDGNFTTCPLPNPTNKDSLNFAVKNYLLRNHNDILIATDPDGDRISVTVNQKGKPVYLSGDDIGVLLLHWIIRKKKGNSTLPKDAVVIKTIVSNDFINVIADKHRVEVIEVLTGFKFIAEQIQNLHTHHRLSSFILGFEERNGYLTNYNIRDKDALNAAILICEMANDYKKLHLSLVDVLALLKRHYGKYEYITHAYNLSDFEKLNHIFGIFSSSSFRNSLSKVIKVADFKKGYFIDKDGNTKPTNVRETDIIKFYFKNRTTLTIRASLTEPVLKVFVFSKNKKEIFKLLDAVENIILNV